MCSVPRCKNAATATIYDCTSMPHHVCGPCAVDLVMRGYYIEPKVLRG